MPGKDETNKMKNPPMPDSSPDGREHAAEDEQWVRGRGTPVQYQGVSRRTLLKDGVAALAGLTVLRVAGPTHAFPGNSGEGDAIAWDDAQPDPEHAMAHPGEEVIPWVDQPAENPVPDNVGNLLVWEALDSWLTPADNFFFVNHYGQPNGLDEAMWRVDIGGLVARPQSLTLAYLKTRPRHG
jgi:DMSO/TMAO reductase YedYZ molybdopterin-dependent catalytic subunit